VKENTGQSLNRRKKKREVNRTHLTTLNELTESTKRRKYKARILSFYAA
jgi:hypothetical protein